MKAEIGNEVMINGKYTKECFLTIARLNAIRAKTTRLSYLRDSIFTAKRLKEFCLDLVRASLDTGNLSFPHGRYFIEYYVEMI